MWLKIINITNIGVYYCIRIWTYLDNFLTEKLFSITKFKFREFHWKIWLNLSKSILNIQGLHKSDINTSSTTWICSHYIFQRITSENMDKMIRIGDIPKRDTFSILKILWTPNVCTDLTFNISPLITHPLNCDEMSFIDSFITKHFHKSKFPF